MQALLSLAQEATTGPLGLGGQFSYSLDDFSALHPSVLGHALQGPPPLQQSLQPQQPPLLAGAAQPLMPVQQGPAQSQVHEALLANMAQVDPTNPAFYPFNLQSIQGINPVSFANPAQLQAFLQQRQQGLSPASVHSSAGEHPMQPGALGRMSSMPEGIGAHQPRLPLQQQPLLSQQQSVNTVFAMGQQQMQLAGHERPQQQLNPQQNLMSIFDPTVRRPGQNFSEAPPVFQDPQVEPCLSQQIPTHSHAHGPRRGSAYFRAPRSAPY